MTRFCAGVLAGGCCLGFLVGTARGTTPLTTERVASGLRFPVFVTAPPNDFDRLFIVEQFSGEIKILNLGTGVINATPFLTVTGLASAPSKGCWGWPSPLIIRPAASST